jgi:hypothetical protein
VKNIDLNESWISGKGQGYEINAAYSTVSIGTEFFCQGESADIIISEIHSIWMAGDLSVDDAVKLWSNIYL